VSGLVEPDHEEWNRGAGAVSERIGSKLRQVTAEGGGDVPAEVQRRRCLSDEQIQGLWELGRRVEEVFGPRQDVEWAFAGGELFCLQVRPIATARGAGADPKRIETWKETVRAWQKQNRGPWARHNL